jgi:hypothetical protein
MASEKDFELLDDYLANRLSGDEKGAFEQRMEGDPELKREYTVQQNIVEGIKRARAAELKGMLQNTAIPAPSFTETMFAKVGAAAVVTGLIVAGVWFFTKDKQEEVKQEPAPMAEKAPDTVQPETIKEEPKTETADANETVAEEPKAAEEVKVAPKSSKKTTKKKEEADQPQKPAELFDPSSELEASTPPVVAEQPTVDQIKKAGLRESTGSSATVNPKAITNHKKYNFHYQFQNGDLLLYGPEFKDIGTYEILEFFLGKKDTTAYLYHNNKYYLLDRNASEPVKLTAIEDQALINALDERRKTK